MSALVTAAFVQASADVRRRSQPGGGAPHKGTTHYKPSGLGDAPVLCGSTKKRNQFVSGYWAHVNCLKCLTADIVDEAKMDDAQYAKARGGR